MMLTKELCDRLRSRGKLQLTLKRLGLDKDANDSSRKRDIKKKYKYAQRLQQLLKQDLYLGSI